MKYAIIALLLTGCYTHNPVIDYQSSGKSSSEFGKDMAECKQIANEQPSAGTGAVGGAVAGALAGLIVGKAFNGNTSQLAKFGAVTGGASGAVSGAASQDNIYKNCLRYRGYSVLN
jgi:outer membrane lipoprotein SlyB